MTNQELFEQAVAGNWIAESFDPRDASDGVGKFYLGGSGKGYSTFSDSIDDGQVVFYAAFDDDCNREAGYGIFNADDMSITPVETTATLRNDKYIDGDVAPVPFPNGGTITGTFNAIAFNAIWAHIWDKNNPHEVNAEQVEQDNDNLLGDNVQDALDNLSGIIAEWDNAIKSTAQNYVQELPPPNPQKGDMWTDVGVTGEQYVWEGEYWVSVTGGGLGVDLDDLDSYSSKVTTDVVEDDQLYDIPLERVISSTTGMGKWVAGGDGSGDTFVPEAPDDGLQYGRQSGTWTEIDAGGVWDADGINGPDGGGIGHYYHLSNAENTNIFKTTIGSDEVEMMGLTSIQLSGFAETWNDGWCVEAIDINEWSEAEFGDTEVEMGRVSGQTGFTNTTNRKLGTIIDGWGNISTSKKITAEDYLDADGNSIVYKYDFSHEHAPNIMLNSYMSDEGGIVAKLGGGQDTVRLMLSRGKFDPSEEPEILFGKPDYLYMGPNTRGVPSDLGSYEEPSKRFTNAYFEGKVQAVDFLDADGNSIVQPPVDLTGYATETYVDDSIAAIPPTDFDGYATEVYVDEAIDAIELPDGSVLDDYATKTYVDEEIAAIPATDLTGYATETWVGSNYQVKGSYSLTNHNHDDRYYQKTETKKIVVLTEAEYNNLGSKDASTVYFLT